MSYSEVNYTVDGPSAVITLDRPEQLNAWTMTMADEVARAVGEAEHDPAVVGIILTGAGRGFCAGADLSMLTSITGGERGGDRDGAPEVPRSATIPGDPDADPGLRGTYTYFASVGKPVIAAINGACAGMGLPIALGCDLRFAATDAVITSAFVHRGLVAEWGVAWMLNRLVGPGHALDLLFSGRKIDGTEAERIGLVNRAVADGKVVDAAKEYVAGLAAKSSPTSLAVIKRQVYDDLQRSLDASLRASFQLMLDSFKRPDSAEGVASFLERRPPAFPPLAADTDLGSSFR